VVPAPAPVPPQTVAGEHRAKPIFAFSRNEEVANGAPEPLEGDRPASPEWGQDESRYDYDFAHEQGQGDEQVAFPAVESPEDDGLRLTAIHLGGVANLPTNREGIDLRLSAHGLDIIRNDEEIVGRLAWSDIESLEVPSPRVRRRRSRDRARLTVRTSQGDASFEVPGFTSEELHGRVLPLFARFGRR
jgi:hypothetical protein